MFMKRLLLEARWGTGAVLPDHPAGNDIFLRCSGVFAHCECRLARRCWCGHGWCSPAPSSCSLGLRPFTWPAAALDCHVSSPERVEMRAEKQAGLTFGIGNLEGSPPQTRVNRMTFWAINITPEIRYKPVNPAPPPHPIYDWRCFATSP